ncbi:MAG: right-handed parallel beta-helix repeat-containing protein [Methanobrevibacter sp.]|nr:right-handed parallel beta-helix repeat-containing protein [Methanobrevibacter sp.]
MKNIYHKKLIENSIAKKIVFTILLLFLFSIALSNVNAAEINITSSDNLGGTIASATAGDIINLDNGTYTNNVTNITINKNLTIQGNGSAKDVIIDAQKLGRIFSINTNNLNLTFINITFINGNITGNGGAIYVGYGGTRLTLIDCVFDNNTAYSGGAVYNSGNNFSVLNCTFTNNTINYIEAYGGAVYNSGNNFSVINSTFTNNKAVCNGTDPSFDGAFGGAIYSYYNNNFSATNCNFTNNTASSNNVLYYGSYVPAYGGAVYGSSSSNNTLTNCNFINNTARWGGAFYSWYASGLIIEDCDFINSTATSGSGGAIYTEIHNYTIINCNFINNQAPFGYAGAIINHGANNSIINSTFENNRALVSGGAVYIHTRSASGTLSYNFTLENCTFINNSANAGGAVFNQCNSSTLTNNKFIDNNATGIDSSRGGAISNTGNLTVNSCNFTDNNARDYGGAIFNWGNMSLSNNIMIGNSAGLGQMIYNNGSIGVLNLTPLNASVHYVTSGQIFTLFATLTDDMGNTVTGQNMNFWVWLWPTSSFSYIGSSTATEGYAEWVYTVDESFANSNGDIAIFGTYNGHSGYSIIDDWGYLRIVLTTNSTITAPDCKIGDTITIFGVASDENGDPIANTQITLTVAGQSYNVITGANGEWNLSYTPSIGGNLIAIISWNGNSTHAGFTNDTNFNVVKILTNSTITAPDCKVGDTITIFGVATDEDGNPIANTQITLTVAGQSYDVITGANGEWSLSYTPSTDGNFIAIISWIGNFTHAGFTNRTNFNVLKADNNTNNNETDDDDNNNETDDDNNETDDDDDDDDTDDDDTDNDDNNNGKTKRIPDHVLMKETGIPIIAILLVLLCLFSNILRRKQK